KVILHPLEQRKKNKNQVLIKLLIIKQVKPNQATLKKQQILQAKQQNLLLKKHKIGSGRLTSPFFFLSFGT
ncbi:hypothetical protein ACPTI2_13810, partial [Enterococcus faecalis]|uniref:hypothetical protein n=1 Tax=Enterococcus faecalis TaxID=1351 RepID=UPI003CC6149C